MGKSFAVMFFEIQVLAPVKNPGTLNRGGRSSEVNQVVCRQCVAVNPCIEQTVGKIVVLKIEEEIFIKKAALRHAGFPDNKKGPHDPRHPHGSSRMRKFTLEQA